MAALTSALETLRKESAVQSYRIKASTKIFKGSFVGVVGGYLAPMAHATGSMTFVGVAYENVDNSAGSDGDRSARVIKTGSFIANAAAGYTAAQADVGSEMYANTDNEVQKATGGLTNQYKIGSIVEFVSSTKVRIRVDLHTK